MTQALGVLTRPHRATPRRGSSGEASGKLARQILAECQSAERQGVSQLPTERQLASDFGVSRTAVRHALAVLEAEGRITRQVGRGTFLRSGAMRDSEKTELDHVDIGPADVMEVRRLFEPQAMAVVVAWATPRDFEEMERCLAGGNASQTYEEFEAWDLALHRCIVSASHNQLLIRLNEVIESARHGQVWGDLKRRHDSRARRAKYQRQHNALVMALRARDTDRAVEAMRAHLGSVAADLFGSTPG
ncbi:MAG: FCD domain-containing protein [Acidimicrobiales bacterium]